MSAALCNTRAATRAAQGRKASGDGRSGRHQLGELVMTQPMLQTAPVSLYMFFLSVPDSPVGADPDTSGFCTLYKYANEDYINY